MLSPVPWVRGPVRMSHLSTVLGLGLVAVLARVSGGADSPALDYLWFVVVYTAFFYPPRQALTYWLACGVVHALPLLYDAHAVEGNLARDLVVVVPIYCLVGGVVVAGRELLSGALRRARELEARQRRMAEEQASLRRVATAVAAGSPPTAIFALVSSEAGHLLGADGAAIVRYEGGDRVTVLGRWSHDEHGPVEAATNRELDPASLLARLRDGEATPREVTDGEPRRVRLAAAVHTGAALWGALIVGPPKRAGSRPAPRSACPTTPTSSPRPWPTPRIARAWTPRRRSTGSPACPTTAPSASA